MFEPKVWVVHVGNKYFVEAKHVFAQTPEQAEVFALQLFTPYKAQYGDPLVYKKAKVVRKNESSSTNQRYREN